MESLIKKATSKLSREICLAIREDRMRGAKWIELTKKFGISVNTLHRILKGIHPSIRDEEPRSEATEATKSEEQLTFQLL